jgi:signal transduction histidine kinase
MRVGDVLVAASAITAGAVAVLAAHDPGDDVALLVADAVVGVMLGGAAYVAHQRRPASQVGALMGLTGLTWFLGSFWSGLALLHRGPHTHLLLTYPTGRVLWRPALVAIAAAYVVAAVERIAGNGAVTLGLAVTVGSVATAQHLRATGTARRAGRPALLAALAFTAVLGFAGVNMLAGWQADRNVLWAYYMVIAATAVGLLVDLLRAGWATGVVTDFVIDLGGQPGVDSLRDAVSRALGDPELEVLYWLPQGQRYVDGDGRVVEVSSPAPGRVATPVTDGGSPLAVIVHDAAVLDDPQLVAAVTEGARLAVTNVDMQAAARERIGALAASRRRLVEAGDAQAARLQRELRQRVEHRLCAVDESIVQLRALGELPREVIDQLAHDLDDARDELDDFARGLHPRGLAEAGLGAALRVLTRRLAIDVVLTVPTQRLSPSTEATIYFVCAEALTNVAKHASARHTHIQIAVQGPVVSMSIVDDGLGGADAARGSGIDGLRDRVAAAGGQLTIDSRAGAGTQIHAVIPI